MEECDRDRMGFDKQFREQYGRLRATLKGHKMPIVRRNFISAGLKEELRGLREAATAGEGAAEGGPASARLAAEQINELAARFGETEARVRRAWAESRMHMPKRPHLSTKRKAHRRADAPPAADAPEEAAAKEAGLMTVAELQNELRARSAEFESGTNKEMLQARLRAERAKDHAKSEPKEGEPAYVTMLRQLRGQNARQVAEAAKVEGKRKLAGNAVPPPKRRRQ